MSYDLYIYTLSFNMLQVYYISGSGHLFDKVHWQRSMGTISQSKNSNLDSLFIKKKKKKCFHFFL